MGENNKTPFILSLLTVDFRMLKNLGSSLLSYSSSPDSSIKFKEFTMNQSLLTQFGNTSERVSAAISALQQGRGVLLVDDENRENEGDIIFSAEQLTKEQVALLIRECSGIICLCMEDNHAKRLDLTPMVKDNSSSYGTAFTVSIEAKQGVTTGVSAADRLTTIKAAIAENAKPKDLSRPGHVFPLVANHEGVLARRGHTEGTVDLMKLAGLTPYGVLCELTNKDGSMAKLKEIVEFAKAHNMTVLSIDDIAQYRANFIAQAV